MIPLTRPFGWRGHVCLRVSASGHHLLRVIFLSCAINFLSPESINAVNVFFLLSVGLCLLMSKPFCSSWRIKNTIFMFMFMFMFFFFFFFGWDYTTWCMFVMGWGCCYLAYSCICCKTPWNIQSPVKIDLVIWSLSLSLSFSLNPHLSRSLSPSDQIPVELPRRRILISHIS